MGGYEAPLGRQYGSMSAHPALTHRPAEHTEKPTPDTHPPKVESFDLNAMTNTDPKGYVRAVDEYRIEPFGLYMARPMSDHPTVAYVESWLLPDLDLRVTDFRFHPGAERDQDFYLDIARIEPGERVWRSVDLYLDIVVRHGQGLEVLDGDELLAAVGAGLLDAPTAVRAMETSFEAVSGIASNGYDVRRWLLDRGVSATWLRR